MQSLPSVLTPSAIIAPVNLVPDPRGVRELLLQRYRLDITGLIQLALEHWHDFDEEALEADFRDIQDLYDAQCGLLTHSLLRYVPRRRLPVTFGDQYELESMSVEAIRQIRNSWESLIQPYLRSTPLPSQLRLERFIGRPAAAVIEVRFVLPRLSSTNFE